MYVGTCPTSKIGRCIFCAEVCAGFNPYKTIPVIIDAGCSDPSGNSANLNIRDHDLYTGAALLPRVVVGFTYRLEVN